MELCDPSTLFVGPVLVLVPHMDDELLACGGTLARIPRKHRIHVAYATDGASSPTPPAGWRGAASSELPAIRMQEAQDAMGVLGVPKENLRFLGFPDGRLAEHEVSLARVVERLNEEIAPSHILIPFRYDRHPDHLALNRAARAILGTVRAPEALEYFVYYRWRLLPGGDVRAYVDPARLVAVDIAGQAGVKRRALACYRSQTTRYFRWQRRPILTPAVLDEACRTPELFLRDAQALVGSAVFTRARLWIRIAHRLEPLLKETKDGLLAMWRGR